MRVPELLLADYYKGTTSVTMINRRWYIAKPYGYQGLLLWRRLKIAFGVFIGKYDAVYYKETE